MTGAQQEGPSIISGTHKRTYELTYQMYGNHESMLWSADRCAPQPHMAGQACSDGVWCAADR